MALHFPLVKKASTIFLIRLHKNVVLTVSLILPSSVHHNCVDNRLKQELGIINLIVFERHLQDEPLITYSVSFLNFILTGLENFILQFKKQ